jgi:hypothetical protein
MSQQPGYRSAFVYGNAILNRAGGTLNVNMIHYGGDVAVQGNPSDPERICSQCRKGTLHFYHNTVFIQADQSRQWTTCLFDLSTNEETVDVRDNVVSVLPATPGQPATKLLLMRDHGVANVYANWFPEGWAAGATEAESGIYHFYGSANVTTASAVLTGTDPGFVDAATLDLQLNASSPAIDAGGALAPGAGAYPVLYQYVRHQGGTARAVRGNAMDLGALER